MKRALVLTNEGARHPFRRMLPPPVVEKIRPYREPISDRALFLMAFVAGFLAVYGMIA